MDKLDFSDDLREFNEKVLEDSKSSTVQTFVRKYNSMKTSTGRIMLMRRGLEGRSPKRYVLGC